jgi:hypothetical protein
MLEWMGLCSFNELRDEDGIASEEERIVRRVINYECS